jgi:hypothetical protein
MKHLTNHAASKHWCQTTGPLVPSSYLGIDVSDDQNTFLNPSIRDVLFSTMESDAYGEKAQKKRARRRQDFIDGNAKSYARWLNSPERMEALSDYNQMMASMALVRKDNDDKRREAQERKAKKAEDKQKQEEAAKEAFERKKAELLPKIKDDLSKGAEHIGTLKGARLKEILRYCFSVKSVEVNKMKVSEMKAAVLGNIDSSN